MNNQLTYDTFTAEELATILAGLRLLRRVPAADLPDVGTPLDHNGINALYERIDTHIPSVWVLTVTHRYGSNIYAAATEALAKAQLAGYVAEWWGNEIPNDPIPENPDQAIREYFERVEREVYELTQVPITTRPPADTRHPGAPIASIAAMECDFCSAQPVRWSYPATDVILIPGIGSASGWAACAICHTLIVGRNFSVLARRIVDRFQQAHPEATHDTPALFRLANISIDAFLAHRTGDAVEHIPSD